MTNDQTPLVGDVARTIICVTAEAAQRLADHLREARWAGIEVDDRAVSLGPRDANGIIAVALLAVYRAWATESAVADLINSVDDEAAPVVVEAHTTMTCPHPDAPGYDPNPTMVCPPSEYRIMFLRYARQLDTWHPRWWEDTHPGMAAELREIGDERAAGAQLRQRRADRRGAGIVDATSVEGDG